VKTSMWIELLLYGVRWDVFPHGRYSWSLLGDTMSWQ